jgi:hypothetical protein
MESQSPRIAVLSERPLMGWDRNFLEERLIRAGVAPSDTAFLTLADGTNFAGNVLLPLGERCLSATTGKSSIHKWQLSPLDTSPEWLCRKAVPTFHPDSIKADWSLGMYVEKACVRAREESHTRDYVRKPKRFLLNPPLPVVLEALADLARRPALAIDIETGRGQINTVGFAWSESDAIAINVLPERMGADSFRTLWDAIRAVCEGPSAKYMQNGIYETLYFARYGIRIANFRHDTMVANKCLWPEFEKGLGNVGRLYTREPYWKDSGRVESEEGGRKDWGAVRDWTRHYTYNAMDASGTFEAARAQAADLTARGLTDLHDNYLVRTFPCVAEMCLRGLPLCEATRTRLVTEYEGKVADLTARLSQPINTRSPKQKLALFEAKGYVIPKVRDAVRGGSRKSVNELSLKKMRLKHPEDPDIPLLLEIAEYEKALSSYLRVECDPISRNVHFMLDPHGTETGRWSCSKDAWSRGFNAQTLPYYVKEAVAWPK